jgi:prepilin-type N-terminal cleavage/methylation domain-containing protein
MESRMYQKGKHCRRGFTLAELMIVVLIIGILQAIAMPNFMRARETSRAKACVENLHRIEMAKEQWALETGAPGSATPKAADLFGATLYLRSAPHCPSSGDYTLGSMAEAPTCSVWDNGTAENSSDDHIAP